MLSIIRNVLLAIVAGLILIGGLGVKSVSASQRCGEQYSRHCAQVHHGYSDYRGGHGYGHSGYGYRLRSRISYRFGGGYGYYPRGPRGYGYGYNTVYVVRPPRVVYVQLVQRPQLRARYVVQPQQPQVASTPPCVSGYTREYQMTVKVGGEDKPAYGIGCWHPDGAGRGVWELVSGTERLSR